MSVVAYNAYDPVQQSFLSALALGETGGGANAGFLGTGGSDLSGNTTDQYGFPIWSGVGNSHAAGTYQFQPSTWDSIAQEYNLNFSNAQDQNAGAWYLAQQADPDLEADLQAGNYSKVQSALQSIWPSVTGNAAIPQGLAAALASGQGAPIAGPSTDPTSPSSSASTSTNPFAIIENWFLRGGLIVVGTLVILISLWYLLANQGIVPGPRKLLRNI